MYWSRPPSLTIEIRCTYQNNAIRVDRVFLATKSYDRSKLVQYKLSALSLQILKFEIFQSIAAKIPGILEIHFCPRHVFKLEIHFRQYPAIVAAKFIRAVILADT